MRLIAKIVLPLVVIALGAAGALYFVLTRPEISPSKPEEREWTVSAARVKYGEARPQLTLFGEVVAGREVEMRALVAGQVIEVGPGFLMGGIVRTGDLLVAIDPFEYRATLDERTARLSEARARLREIQARFQAEMDALEREREQLVITERDLVRVKKLHAKSTVSAKALDSAILAHSKQQQRVDARLNSLTAEGARLDQQRAVIKRLEVTVRRARRDLKQTHVVAPFDGFVLDVEAELGKRVGVNDRLARIIDAGRLEISFHLSDAQFGRILAAEGGFKGRAAGVVWRTGERGNTFTATVERVSSTIEAASGGVDLYARLVDAGLDKPLRPGVFVEVSIADRAYANVARLPESALHGDDTVYVILDGRVSPRRVALAARDGDDILVSGGLEEGAQVVTTRFAEIGPGVRVRVR